MGHTLFYRCGCKLGHAHVLWVLSLKILEQAKTQPQGKILDSVRDKNR